MYHAKHRCPKDTTPKLEARLIIDHGNAASLGRKLGMKRGAFFSQLLSDPPLRPISEKVARKWEDVLGLPVGWMDDSPEEKPVAINADLLEGVLKEVMRLLKENAIALSPARLAELVALEYVDAARNNKIDSERIHKIVRLLRKG